MDTQEKQTQTQDTKPMGIWAETINPHTGSSSLQVHTPKVVWQGCGKCYWLSTQDPRIVVCKKCKQERKIIIGYNFVKNGKITEHGRYT